MSDAAGLEGPLAAFTVLVAGDSRVSRFVADLFTGLGTRLVPTGDNPPRVVHALDPPGPAAAAVEAAAHLDALVVVGEPGRVQAARLGPESCASLRPAAVHASADEGRPTISLRIAGRMETTTAPLVAAACGPLLGFSDPGEPRPLELPLPDFATALTLVLAVTAALTTADEARGPTTIRTSVTDATPLMTIDSITQSLVDAQDVSRASRHRHAQLYVARCAGGSGLTLHLSSSEPFWRAFVRAIGRDDVLEDPRFATYADRVRHYEDIVDIVSATLAGRPLEEWEPILEAADVPFAPLLTPVEAMRLPQVRAIGLDDPDCVPTGTSLLRPLRFDGRRPARRQEARS